MGIKKENTIYRRTTFFFFFLVLNFWSKKMQAYAELLEEGYPKIPAWFFSPKDEGITTLKGFSLKYAAFCDNLRDQSSLLEGLHVNPRISKSTVSSSFFHLKPAKAIVDAIQLEPAKAIENENYALTAGIQDQNSELESGGTR
ncbi:hypothetical protein C5167_047732 [Papaver somniferum]|uniref:Uncharacterized protein n=1 Tax=Papaver somniferum TaxID=3469 RepID=A0A4Y7LLK8_PAPSO|nr:hypothetical protein C5167_047732 [Papaver somniferum]